MVQLASSGCGLGYESTAWRELRLRIAMDDGAADTGQAMAAPAKRRGGSASTIVHLPNVFFKGKHHPQLKLFEPLDPDVD